MSLYSPSSSDIQASLAQQKKRTLVSSLLIAILAFSWIGLVLYVISLKMKVTHTSEIIAYSIAEEEIEREQPEVISQVEPPPSPASSSIAKIIASISPVETQLPIPDIDTPELSLDLSAAESFELNAEGDSDLAKVMSTQQDTKGSPNFKSLPKSLSSRCTRQERLKRLKKSGGSAACEDAVVQSLEWMRSTQKKNGSWTRSKPVGMTSLALLAYLGHCETSSSPDFGLTVENAIIYLVNTGLKNNGLLASNLNDRSWPYEHAISTYALAEAFTLNQQVNITIPNLEEVLQKAGKHIIDNQHISSGGWDYDYARSSKRGGDSSITCWQLQALKACKSTRLRAFNNLSSTTNKGLSFLEQCQRKDGGVYYETRIAGAPFPTMTGGAILCHQQWGKGNHSLVRRGIKYISENTTFVYQSENSDLYAHYYYSQALINRGGRDWFTYNSQIRDELLKNQNSNGSWSIPGGGAKIKGSFTKSYASKSKKALHYRTCLATLILEVYYRYLPGSR